MKKSNWIATNKAAYQKVGRKYDIFRPVATYIYLSKFFKKHIHIDEGKEILDFGCGTGNSTKFIDNIANNCRITGIDQASNMLKRAKTKSFKNKTKFLNKNIESFSSKKKFDIIQFFQVIHHFNDLNKIIKILKKILKKNGKIIFIDVFSNNKLVKLLDSFYAKYLGQGKYKARTFESMNKELKKHKLKIEKNITHPLLKNYGLIVVSKT